MHFSWLLRLSTALFLYHLAEATLVSFTIDDELGDPSTGQKVKYEPPEAWGFNTIAQCHSCLGPYPQSQLVYKNTWHGSVFNSGNSDKTVTPRLATVLFYGTAVSVNCILSNSLAFPTAISDMKFLIDGQQVDTFSLSPTGASDFQFNHTVFSTQGLSLGNHSLTIQNGRSDGGISLVLLDSITYSYDDQTQTASAPSTSVPVAPNTAVSSKPAPNATAIAGGIVGTLAVLLLVLLLFLIRRHQKRRSNMPITTLPRFAPLRRLWPGAQPAQQGPDMAPVPYPTSPLPVRHLASPSPGPPILPPIAAPPDPSSRSRLSFNPNLLVGRFQRRPSPLPSGATGGPPVVPITPRGEPYPSFREPTASTSTRRSPT
ncbi:hypothetical protein C8J57DRAFT_41151 [Mycena rebaudengoi]|nr:hypothetical protein C8J57DRAFT_41151 [Mycena rebaudengoi]